MLVSVEERVIGDSVGYIRIRGFHNNTTEQFKAAYSALEEAGVGSIIFDLRGNTAARFSPPRICCPICCPGANMRP